MVSSNSYVPNNTNSKYRLASPKDINRSISGNIKWWAHAKDLQTQTLAEIELKAPRYILRDKNGGGLLPEGLCIITGDPKASKSTILRAFMSIFTTGQDALQADSTGECLILSFEDDKASIQLPAVIANGGDPRKFHFPVGNCFNCSAKDLRQKVLAPIAKFLESHPNCKVIVIDVLSSMLASLGINSQSAEKARSVLEPLNQLGLEFGVSFVVLHHNHKSQTANRLHRMAGSIQVAASARLVWMVEKHPENENMRVLRPVGGNIPGHSAGLVFTQEKLPQDEGLRIAASKGIETVGDLKDLEFFKTVIVDEPLPEAFPSVKEEVSEETKAEQCAAFMAEKIDEKGALLSKDMETECLKTWSKGTINGARLLLRERGYPSKKVGKKWYLLPRQPEEKGEDGSLGVFEESYLSPSLIAGE